jgi:hypothetical protein
VKIGDLVWHIEDIKADCATPGLVFDLDIDPDDEEEYVIVRFTDRDIDECHPTYDLVVNLDATTR